MEYTVAAMTADQVPQTAAIEAACFTEPWSEEAFAGELENASAWYCTATRGQQVLGFGGMQTVLDEGYVTNIAVLSSCRRQGIGRALVAALLREAERRELAFLTLEVREGNTAAITLYQSMGFEEAGRRKNFYRLPTEDALLMTHYFR